MYPESNLDVLLGSMEPVLDAPEYVFCSIEEERLAGLGVSPICVFREAEGVTAILRRDDAERLALSSTFPCRRIALSVQSSLEAVGFLATIATTLAQHGISVNAVSAYYHDHLFVPISQAERALQLLQELQLTARNGRE
jgi:hypothetical protein